MAENRYYWLKLKRDFFKRHDIRIIESMANGKDYLLFYLKLLCESVDHEGNLRFSKRIPYNEDMLATITDTNVDIVRAAITIFTQLEMMEIMDDGTLYMNEVNKMIGSAVDNDNANRQRRFRERQKQDLLQERYDIVTKNNESKSIEKETDKELDKDNINGSLDAPLSVEKPKKSKPKDEKKTLVEGFTDDEELRELIFDFIKMRKDEMKNPMSERAVKLMLTELKKLSLDTETQKKIVEQSIKKGWNGMFPLQEDKPKQQTQQYKPKYRQGQESVYSSDASYDLDEFGKRAVGLRDKE